MDMETTMEDDGDMDDAEMTDGTTTMADDSMDDDATIDDATVDDAAGGSPGFGLVVAVLALLAVAGFARRR
jgi:PGF-CTERM protein